MKQIYLVRHGESVANVDLSEYGHTPDHAISLSDLGQRQAEKTGEFLYKHFNKIAKELGYMPKIRVHFSPYLRTRQTKDGILKHIGNIIHSAYEDRRLIEQRFGIFDGLTEDQQEQQYPDEYAKLMLQHQHQGKYWAVFPGAGGESPYDVDNRSSTMMGTFYRDADKHGIEHVIIVSHGITTRVMANRILRQSYEDYNSDRNPSNASVRLLEKKLTGWKDRRYIFAP